MTDKPKPPMALIPSNALSAIAQAMGYGAQTHARDDYRSGVRWSDLVSKVMRHVAAWNEGKDLDESGFSHLAHAAADLAILLDLEARKAGTDDRWKPPSQVDDLGAPLDREREWRTSQVDDLGAQLDREREWRIAENVRHIAATDFGLPY